MGHNFRENIKRAKEHEVEFFAKIGAKTFNEENVNFHDRKREIDSKYDSVLEPYKAQLKAINNSINAIKQDAKNELMAEFISRLYKGAVFEGVDDGPSGGCIKFMVTEVFDNGVRLKTEYSEEYYSFSSLIWRFDWFSFRTGGCE